MSIKSDIEIVAKCYDCIVDYLIQIHICVFYVSRGSGWQENVSEFSNDENCNELPDESGANGFNLLDQRTFFSDHF